MTTTERVAIHCDRCHVHLGTVHPPAPPVPVTCEGCRKKKASASN